MFPQSAAGMIGGQLLAETIALISRMSVRPSNARIFTYNKLIRDLKVAGLYTTTKIKALYLLAAHDAQAARLNIMENSMTLSVVSTMTFTTNLGYAGDGASGELTVAPGATVSALSHCAGFWINDFAANSGYINTHGSNAFLRAQSSGSVARWGQLLDTNATGVGAHRTMSTNDTGATIRFYANGALADTETPGAGTNFSGSPVHIGLGYTGRHAAAHWGPDLNGTEQAALYAALNAYLTALGAA